MNLTRHSFRLAVCMFLAYAAAAGAQRPAERLPDEQEAWAHGKAEMERWARFRERLEADREKKVQFPQDDFDAAHYDITLDIDVTGQAITGTLAAKVVALTPGITQVIFDLMANMTVSDVRENGATILWSHANDLLTMMPTGNYSTGDTLRLEIDYSGPPSVPNTELGGLSSFTFGTHGGGQVVIFTLSEPYLARSWWPCKDVPDDKATVTMDVTVPDTLVVASNGALQSETNLGGGRKSYHWAEAYPISTYLVSLAVSNYAEYSDHYVYSPTDSMEVRYYVYPEAGNVYARWDTITVPMVEHFAALFGEYPFLTEKYGMAQINGQIAMENQTCSSMGVTTESIVAHELSHQWWGDMVSPADWRDIWLNEGFAAYCEALWAEHSLGFDRYKLVMRSKKSPFGWDGTLYDPPTLFDPFDVYGRGAWVMHMLRHVMGDSAFFASLAQYRSDFAYGNATTVGFKNSCEQIYGQSLDWFFDQWVFGWSVPEYEYHWRQEHQGASSVVDLTMWQTQETGLIMMPVDVHVSMVSGDSIVVLWNDSPLQSYRIMMPDTVTDVQIDPDEWILREVAPRDIGSFPAINVFPNPFNAGTRISFELNVAGNVEVTVYSVSGELVRTLQRGPLPPGFHEVSWDGKNGSGQVVATGVYFVRLKTPQSRGLRKAVHIK